MTVIVNDSRHARRPSIAEVPELARDCPRRVEGIVRFGVLQEQQENESKGNVR